MKTKPFIESQLWEQSGPITHLHAFYHWEKVKPQAVLHAAAVWESVASRNLAGSR